jgi:6-phospho-beta-glucosidase
VVNVRSDGALPGLADGDVVEICATVGRQGATPIPVGAVPPEMLGLIQHVKAFEHLTVEAATSGDRRTALLALVANPLVREFAVAEQLLAALLEANRPFLPRFFPD